MKANKCNSDKKVVAGESVNAGKISINISSDYIVEFSPCYCNGYESKIDKTNYLISCYRIEGKSITKNPKMIKEWIINGNPRGLQILVLAIVKIMGESLVKKNEKLLEII